MFPGDEAGVSFVFPVHLSEHDRVYLRMIIGAGNRDTTVLTGASMSTASDGAGRGQ
jgi:hypothetical protein